MHLAPSLSPIPLVSKASVCDIVEIAVLEYEKGGTAFRGRGVGIHIVDMEVVQSKSLSKWTGSPYDST